MFNRSLRKSKQEIADPDEIAEILRRGQVCRLAMCRGNVPYVVPLNYGYADGSLYFHCADEGLKVDILKENNTVSFEITIDTHLKTNDEPCNWSQFYRSIIGFGHAVFLKTREEKRRALLVLMNHYVEKDWEIPDAKIDNVTLIEVKIDNLTAKKNAN